MLFFAIVLGLVFGSQAYNGIKHFIFPDYYKGFWNLKVGLWLMCVGLDGIVIYKAWWTAFVIGSFNLLVYMCFINSGKRHNYLATPNHPDGKRKSQ